MDEFDLIQQYFTPREYPPSVRCGVGDDAAVIAVKNDFELVTSVDCLVENVHFFTDAKPEDIAYKVLAVGLSDLAAMGAKPHNFLLSLTLPQIKENWIAAFSREIFRLAQQYDVSLIGGNISSGPLTITTVVNGWVPAGSALLRSGAEVGDLIYVTGELGGAALACQMLKDKISVSEDLLQAFYRPQPRIQAGLMLRGLASAAIDVSDGLLADLMHLISASGVGARIHTVDIPLASQLLEKPEVSGLDLALTGGEDYELCFTLPKDKQSTLLARFKNKATCIGEIIAGDKISVYDAEGEELLFENSGWQHF